MGQALKYGTTSYLSRAELREIPILSVVREAALKLFSDDRVPLHVMARSLKKDQILSAKILRLANSGLYGRGVEIASVEKAIHFLGDSNVRAVVLGTNILSEVDLEKKEIFDLREFWRSSVAAAVAAEQLAIELKLNRSDEAFSCALLRDIGKLVLFHHDWDSFQQTSSLARIQKTSLIKAEHILGHPGHNLLGERLAEFWSLPLIVRKMIRYHHRNLLDMPSIYTDFKESMIIASLGSSIAYESNVGFGGDYEVSYPVEVYLKHLNVSNNLYNDLRINLASVCEEIFKKIESGEPYLGLVL